MSTAFRPKIEPAEQERSFRSFLKPRGIAFKGALFAGVLAGGLTWGGGQYLMKVDFEGQAKESGIALLAHAEVIAKEIGNPIDSGDSKKAMDVLHKRLRAIPHATAFLLDAAGEPLLPGAPEGDGKTLAGLHEVIDGVLLGGQGQAKVLEVRHEVRGRLLSLGTLYIRQDLPAPIWAGGIVVLAQWTSIISAVLTFLFLSVSIRGLGRLHWVLDRAGAGDFYERAPAVGCFEIRELVKKTHDVLQRVGASQEVAQKVYVETAIALSKTIEAKDRYTSGHSQRVTVYAVEMGEILNFDEDRLETLRLGALLHDIGKVAVPDDVLLKPGALTDDEFVTMKRHPMAGDRILSAIPGLRDMADIARSHHEKWDGTGYPLGVAGDSIPLEGRIVAIADAYDALITKRSYKPAMAIEKALNIIEADAGTHFDPQLASLFVAMKRNGKGYKPLPSAKAVEAPRKRPKEAL
ncbi:MAG: HD-GYP domain-containing protein [Planctomycetota bacterium]|nr:HD-GYP domain-containing protein [Planctomycetota bacterium]MDA1113525.1 HD-GYP domain-containing protein [Planctomycetota bacterium]